MDDRPIRIAVQSLKQRIPAMKDRRQDTFLLIDSLEKYIAVEEASRRNTNLAPNNGERMARKILPTIKGFFEFFDSEPRFLEQVLNKLINGIGDEGNLLDEQKATDTYPELDKLGKRSPEGAPPAQEGQITQGQALSIEKALGTILTKLDSMDGRIGALEASSVAQTTQDGPRVWPSVQEAGPQQPSSTKPQTVGDAVREIERRGPGRPPKKVPA